VKEKPQWEWIQKRDRIKDEYCKENEIDLMRITKEDL